MDLFIQILQTIAALAGCVGAVAKALSELGNSAHEKSRKRKR